MTQTPSNPLLSPRGQSGKEFHHGNCSISVSASSERELLGFRWQLGSEGRPAGPGFLRALCVSVGFSPVRHSAAEPQLKRDCRMPATKRLKMLKKEFLLCFLCLFVAKKILSA